MPDSSVKGTNGRKYQPMKLKFSRAEVLQGQNRRKSIQNDAAIMESFTGDYLGNFVGRKKSLFFFFFFFCRNPYS